MPEQARIYHFDDYTTASEEIAEVFFYLKQIQGLCGISEHETVDSLVEKQTAVSGSISRIKSSLRQFMKNEYQTDLDKAAEKGYARQMVDLLDEMKTITFYFREAAMALPAEKLKDNLRRTGQLVARLPAMAAALDAGEDEVNNGMTRG